MSSIYDYPFWKIEWLLSAIARQRGVPNDAEAIRTHQQDALVEIGRLAAKGRLQIFGRRCRLELPNRLIPEGETKVIPSTHFIQDHLVVFLGYPVLMPPHIN
jgi:hypothetical protein